MASVGTYDNLSLSGKVAIITGSSAGIGRETAILFIKRGAKVVLHGRNEDRLHALQNEIVGLGFSANNLLIVSGDIVDPGTQERLVSETVKKFKKIDCLVNNAGNGKNSFGSMPEINREALIDTFDLFFIAPVLLAQKCYPYLKEVKGTVINVSSIGATIVSDRALPYSAAKSALDRFTAQAAVEWAADEIRVNSIVSGWVKTNILYSVPGFTKDLVDQITDVFEKITPVGYVANPIEIAEAIGFMASNASRYCTGSKMVVDGGFTQAPVFTMSLRSKQ